VNLIWVQMLGVILTFGASSFTFIAARSANRSQADVANRTTSLTEFEKALTFQGVQLDRLRVQVMEREEAEARCQAEKDELRRQLQEARGR
jgi:hypothetical protein